MRLIILFVFPIFAFSQEIISLEIPKTPFKDSVVAHKGYFVSYNTKFRQPNWVGYLLTKKETVKVVDRSDKFCADPLINHTDNLNDYKKSGYDRGHIAPSADMTFSKETMEESFYFSNICPQIPEFNRGIWKDLEEKIRIWAVQYDSIYIIAGPIFSDSVHKTIGTHKILVPTSFFKVIYVAKHGKESMIGFVIPNQNLTDSFMKYAVPIDTIEKQIKYDFFAVLKDEKEQQLESIINTNFWK